MELAVNMPAQEPQVGQALASMASSRASVISPLCTLPTPSKTVMRSLEEPSGLVPASIGPPVTKMVGTFTRRAPMIMPGVILSQLGMQMSASKQWAMAMVSTASAMSSRLGSE